MTSTFSWVNPKSVETCRKLGFTVQTGRGENRYYIMSSDNPFNPAADMHRIPQDALSEVTIRATIDSSIQLGRYILEQTEMRVSASMVTERHNSGFFTGERKVESLWQRDIDLRAPTLADALHIFQLVLNYQLKPDPTYTAEVMGKFD